MAVMGVVLSGLAAPAWASWSKTPLEEWTDGPTLEVVQGATAPFGTWTEKDGTLTAQGTAHCWETQIGRAHV